MTFPSEPQLARSFELIWDCAEPGGRMNLWPPNYPGIQDSDFWHSASFSSWNWIALTNIWAQPGSFSSPNQACDFWMTPQRYDAWGATEDAAPLWRLALWQSDNGKFPPSMGKHMCVSCVDHLQLNDFSMVYLRLVSESAVQSKLAAGVSGTEYFTTALEGQLA